MDNLIKQGLRFNLDLSMLPSEQEVDNWEKIQKGQIEELKQNKYENSGVGKKYWNLRLEDYQAYNDELKNNLEVVKTYIGELKQDKPKTLWLCGNSGTGKTFLGAMIVREAGGYFTKSYKIEDDLEVSKSYSSKENKTAVLKRYSEYPVLVIDEIAKFEGRSEIEYLFRILNERYENELSTVLITNKTKKELRDYIGKPLYDRFIENCTALEFLSESYRIKQREK